MTIEEILFFFFLHIFVKVLDFFHLDWEALVQTNVSGSLVTRILVFGTCYCTWDANCCLELVLNIGVFFPEDLSLRLFCVTLPSNDISVWHLSGVSQFNTSLLVHFIFDSPQFDSFAFDSFLIHFFVGHFIELEWHCYEISR